MSRLLTFGECLEWWPLLLPLWLQTEPTVSNGRTILVVVVVATFDECLERRALLLPLLLQTGPTVSNERTIVVVVVAIFSNVSSGASCCWPTSHFETTHFTTCNGATLQIGPLLPLRGRIISLANTLTYPYPSHPALLHEDTTLHGAPTVEEHNKCRQNTSL